jgi:hypothetical protein
MARSLMARSLMARSLMARRVTTIIRQKHLNIKK